MKLTLAFNTARLKQDLDREKAKIRRVARRVVNHAAISAANAVVAEMKRSFDLPTPYVLNGVQVELASDSAAALEAAVDWKFAAGNKSSGPGAGKVLRAQIEGGQRRLKRFEKALGLPENRAAVPGKWAELDAYGNIKSGQLVKILSYLRLFGEVGYLANRRNRASRGRRRSEEYFMIRPGTNHKTLSPGIYRIAQEMGGAPLMVIAFVRAPRYPARFAPAEIVRATVTRNIATWWTQGLQGRLPSLSARITGA
jgi:hypothetical protein